MIASISDKLRGGVGAALIVGLLGYMLVFGLPVAGRLIETRSALPISLDPPIRVEPRPKPVPKPVTARPVAGRASPPNRRNKASPIVVPLPIVPPLVRPPLVAAVKAGPGAAASSGASERAGPGDGAGGMGDGTGSGRAGEGDGDGDGGESGDSPPRLIKGRLRFADLPAALRDMGVRGTVSVSYDVDADGRVSHCAITQSSGDPALDEATCDLIARKFRYAPSRTPDGEAVSSIIEESHRWDTEHRLDPGPG